jgi:glycosyltransferase involved in cell wall biosynthesis
MRDPSVANQGFPGFSAEYHDLLDMQVASSDDLRRWMIARGAPAEQCTVLYTATDVEHWRPDPERRTHVRAEMGLAEDMPLILHAARITAQKQPRVLVQVLLELARRGLSYRAVVAGDGPELPWLREFVRRNGLRGSVTLLGAVDAGRMRDLMAAGDILFLPSAYEGLSLALFEAMACGVVPVTVDAGGQPELVTPDCGILVAPDEQQESRYVAALEWLLRSPRQRKAMAAAARRRVVGHFNAEQLAERFDDLIDQARGVAQARALQPASAGAGAVAASAAVEELRVYIHNHRLRSVVLAWEWWKRRGARHIQGAMATREALVRRTYPLRRAVRPFWMRLRYGKH